MISAVVLAAGLSTRMRRPKLVLPIGREAMLEMVLGALRRTTIDEVVVVLGADSERIREVVRFEDERVVVNPKFREGMSSSLKLGLESISQQSDAVLVVLGDQPFVSPATVEKMIEGYAAKNAPIVVPVYKGGRGNPVLLARRVFPEITKITGDVGAKSVVRSYGAHVLEVPVRDAGVTLDVDTPHDYERASAAMRRRNRGGG